MPVFSSGVVVIPSGVTSTVTGLLIVQEARLEVLDGGLAIETGAAAGGSVVVSEGGILDICTVSSGGTVTILNGGYGSNVAVEADGLYLVSSGGFATKSEVRTGGTMRIFEDVRATNAVVMNGGTLEVNEGAYARAPVVSNGGVVRVNGGVLASALIAGTMDLDSGGVVSSSTVQDGGEFRLLGGDAYAMKIGIGPGGTAHVSDSSELFMVSMFEGASAVISKGGIAAAIRLDGGRLSVLSDASAEDVDVNSGGVLEVCPGGALNGVEVNSGSVMLLSGGAIATGVVENGGCVEVAEDADVTFVKNTISDLLLEHASATVHSGTTAVKPVADIGGSILVFSGGTATDVMENGGYVEVGDGADVTFRPNTFRGLSLSAGQSATVHSGTVAENVIVSSNGRLDVFSDGKLTGVLSFETGAVVSMAATAVLDFDPDGTEAGAAALVNDLSVIQGTPLYTLAVDGDWSPGTYEYRLAGGASDFDGTISVMNRDGETFGKLSLGKTVHVGNIKYSLNLNVSILTLTVEVQEIIPTDLSGSQDRLSWETTGADQYIVECSTDDFGHAVPVTVSGTAMDLLELPAGTYQWRVKVADGKKWAVGNVFDSKVETETPKAVKSDEDGSADLFFASPNGTWGEDGYMFLAMNAGSVNDWTGTNELVIADGKGRIQNLFFGSSDPNVLCLTDAENGDAIFVDDVYTGLPEEIKRKTARLYRIQEIRAGAGDDIVDMTSRRFKYTGDGLTIRGGDGNDTIWANKGNNFLFGDAGNDRIVGASGRDVIAGGTGNDSMHGGGGNDVFTFCDNWGTDTVEQLDGGSVTLWFASESATGVWDEASMTYTDGDNSVKVTGVTSVKLKFGENSPEDAAQFAALSDMGAFAEFTSQRIFEESGKGILASL